MAWMDIPAAAAVMGRSERTLRRRIEAGTLVNRRQNGRVQVQVEPAQKSSDQQLVDVAAGLAIQAREHGHRFDLVVDTLAAAGVQADRRAKNAARVALVAVVVLVIVMASAGIGYVALDHQHRDQAQATAVDQVSLRASRIVSDGLADQVRDLREANAILAEQVDRLAAQLDQARAQLDQLRAQLARAAARDVVGFVQAVADQVRGVVGPAGGAPKIGSAPSGAQPKRASTEADQLGPPVASVP